MSGLANWLGALAIAGGNEIGSTIAHAVVQLGQCSGTLIAADVVLTSAHCLGGPIDKVVADGRAVGAAHCERHPRYQPDLPAHDIGYCRLAEALPGAVSVDDGELAIGASVVLAGFGVSSALSREKPKLRTVATSVGAVREEWLEVGSATATACRGDSGGPMLVDRGGSLRVAGVIHGPTAAICASPTEVVPVTTHRAWLLHALDASSNGSSGGGRQKAGIVLGALLVTALLIASTWWRRARSL